MITLIRVIPVALAVCVMFGTGMFTSAVHAQEPTLKIEILAKDYQLTVVSGYTIVGDPTEIIFRNEDTITHGFNFSLFGEVQVELEEGGYLAEGKGPHVYRVDPGKTMVLKFTWVTRERPASTTYAFWCDLHLDMEGEMFVVEIKKEAGR